MFVDADSLHPPANVAKMAAGHPLTDDDRWPWLARVRQELRGANDIVIACSALTRRYRDLLRHAGDVRFVFLALDAATARDRALQRTGHFMGADMVASQFSTLEPPEADETDIVAIDGAGHVDWLSPRPSVGLATAVPGTSAVPLIADGRVDRTITADELARHMASLVEDHVLAAGRPARAARAARPHPAPLAVGPDHRAAEARARGARLHGRGVARRWARTSR